MASFFLPFNSDEVYLWMELLKSSERIIPHESTQILFHFSFIRI